MKLTEEVKIIFKNKQGLQKELPITIGELLEKTKEDLYDLLESTEPCNLSGCHNESQNFCDCEPKFEDYEIEEVLI